MINACIGIPSWLPDNSVDRIARIKRLDNLISQIKEFFNLPIIFIAQNWKDYAPNYTGKLHIYRKGKLGIMKARNLLREKFLELGYDYLIMFDDDAIIECKNNANTQYLQLLANNPNGFCFIPGKGSSKYTNYNDSQLNLCAISKYIYEKEPLPMVDPQKSEAFEDRLWSTLLHFKYNNLEFLPPADIKCIHFKNPEIDKLGGEVKSTWAVEQKYDWISLRQNTANIETYIAKYKTYPNFKLFFDKVDLVVPYVDSTDQNWQKLFNKYNQKKVEVEGINAKNRFRGQGDFFRFFFRCINKNVSWVNNIFLLVQSKSQIPAWLDTKKVKIITHDQFIPKEYLPTFNSCTIEMFLWNIPGLAEKFIYLNDDMFITKQTLKTDFFIDDKVRENFVTTHIGGIFGSHCNNAFKTIYNNDNFIRPDHEVKPYYKSAVKECYFKFEKMIKNSITQFRDPKNYNCYLYSLYQAKLNLVTTSALRSDCLSTFNLNRLDAANVACINDTKPEINIYNDTNIRAWFMSHFNEQSDYEINDFPKNYIKKEVIKEDIHADGRPNTYLYF